MFYPRRAPLHPDSEDLARQVLAALAGKPWLDSYERGEMRVRKRVKRSAGEQAGGAEAEKPCRPIDRLLGIPESGLVDHIAIKTKHEKRRAHEKKELRKFVLQMKIKLGCLNLLQATEDDYQVSSIIELLGAFYPTMRILFTHSLTVTYDYFQSNL